MNRNRDTRFYFIYAIDNLLFVIWREPIIREKWFNVLRLPNDWNNTHGVDGNEEHKGKWLIVRRLSCDATLDLIHKRSPCVSSSCSVSSPGNRISRRTRVNNFFSRTCAAPAIAPRLVAPPLPVEFHSTCVIRNFERIKKEVALFFVLIAWIDRER